MTTVQETVEIQLKRPSPDLLTGWWGDMQSTFQSGMHSKGHHLEMIPSSWLLSRETEGSLFQRVRGGQKVEEGSVSEPGDRRVSWCYFQGYLKRQHPIFTFLLGIEARWKKIICEKFPKQLTLYSHRMHMYSLNTLTDKYSCWSSSSQNTHE